MPKGEILGPDGKPLRIDPDYIVIKTNRESLREFNDIVMKGIMQIVRKSIILIPMDSEFHDGRMAEAELKNIHGMIHTLTKQPETDFSKDELASIKQGLLLMVEKYGDINAPSWVSAKDKVERALNPGEKKQ